MHLSRGIKRKLIGRRINKTWWNVLTWRGNVEFVDFVGSIILFIFSWVHSAVYNERGRFFVEKPADSSRPARKRR